MVVLITGISSGFGLESARLLASKGHKVYGTVRREVEKLDGVNYLFADVTDREAVQRAVDEVITREGRLDAIVCNAGMGVGGPIEFTSPEDARRQIETNFGGAVSLIQAALRPMRTQRSGRIICVSSIGGLMGLPYQAFYSASKFALEGFCEALRLEVRDFGISVTLVNPGDFSTGFTSGRKKVPSEAVEAYPAYAEGMQKIEHDELGGLKPIVVARTIEKILRKRRPAYHYVVATFEQRLSVLLKRILPARLFSRILGAYYGC
jgi:NAD(P)-dependent dehydrogenase (short-subunit alcohol dehydrogenase family)